MSEIFQQLDSNNIHEVEAVKQKIIDQFVTVKDAWLLNGLYDYYLSTSSANIIMILVNIKEPHHQFLFDKLSDSIGKHSKTDVKVQALTLLGHIVRNQPTWLYRLSDHHLLKDLLRLLKEEIEIVPLISALLVLIVLIPMIPHSIGEILNLIFDIFSHLASWNCNPGPIVGEQMIHLQVALYALFLRLYGMFPCNFLAYLRAQYKDKNRAVFIHTIKPMLETVKMNPSIVTTSKENETANERWRKMAVYDVIVECERFSLDVTDTFCAHDTCQLTSGFRSRSGTSSNNSSIDAVYFQSLKNFAASLSNEKDFFSPSTAFSNSPAGVTIPPQREFTHDENIVPRAGSSPPETAIEATPETTPIIAEVIVKNVSQPQSPLHNDTSPFKFPLVEMRKPPTSPQKIISERSPRNDQPILKQCDSVLQESGEDSASDNLEEDRSSPCTAGGLHMPNSKSMKNFAKHVQRLRHHSQCQSDPHEICSGRSPEMEAIVRRAISCPEMKKSPVSSLKDNISQTLDEETDGVNLLTNGLTKYINIETQTENFWPMPYEHLFLGIFPSLGVEGSKPSPQSQNFFDNKDKYIPRSINETLDRYLESAIQDNECDSIKGLKNQLKLMHAQLLFERHRREIHAYKNRRFLAEARNTQVLEEHNSALRDQVQLQHKDLDALRYQLEAIQKDREAEKEMITEKIAKLEDKCKMFECESKSFQEVNEQHLRDIAELKETCRCLTFEKEKAESFLVSALAEVKIAKEQAASGEKSLSELDNVNKQLLLIGELQLKYKERLEELASLRRTDQELEMLKETYNSEIKNYHQRFRDKVTKLEGCAAKISELEQQIRQNEETISKQKRTLNCINDETVEKLTVLESKYQTQLVISRCFEEKILDLYKQLEMATRKPIRSPDTSSCQEVQVFSDKVSAIALSQCSSPLSCSLTSSDGSMAQAATELKTHVLDEENDKK